MELLLNVVWCVIVLSSAVRFAGWSRGQTMRRKYAVALATVCALALLFPIISVTDDLRDDPAVFEETSAVRKLGVVAAAHIDAAMTVAALEPAICGLGAPQLQRMRAGARERPSLPLERIVSVVAVRPPPIFVR